MKCISKRTSLTIKKGGLHPLAVLPTEQLVLTLLAFVVILQDSVLEVEKFAKICGRRSPSGEM